MASKRSADEDGLEPKRQKINPYLAHHYEQDAGDNGYSNGYGARQNGSKGALGGMTRHKTTDQQAKEAEDGPDNPFTGKTLSKQYFRILDQRRNLPVHAQRWVPKSQAQMKKMLTRTQTRVPRPVPAEPNPRLRR